MESIFEGYYPWVVTMTAPLPSGTEAAWVSLDLSFSSISSYISNVGIGQRGYCFLMDSDGNIVYHPQQQLLYAGLKSEDTVRLASLRDGTYADDTVIYCVASVGDSGWRVVGVSYVDELVNRQRGGDDPPVGRADRRGARRGAAHELDSLPPAGPPAARPRRRDGEL